MLSTSESALWLLVGAVVGLLTTLTLWWTSQRLQPGIGESVWLPVWAGYILRLGIVAGFLIWAARQGAAPLLWAFGGLAVSRWVTIPWLSRRAGRHGH